MATFDFSHLTPTERLDLIGELWASLEEKDVALTAAQEAEIDRRLASLDEDIKQGQDAFAIYDGLTAKYRNAG